MICKPMITETPAVSTVCNIFFLV